MRSTPYLRALAGLAVALTALLGSAGIAAAAAPSPAPLVVIDAGHGGRYSNANSNGLKEKKANLAIALELRRQLLARGYRVKMTRMSDRAIRLRDTATWNYSLSKDRWYYRADGRTGYYGGLPKDDLQARARIANDIGADLFISIHANGSVNRAARGTETWASRRDRLGVQLAPYVHREIVRRTGLRNRGTHAADFYVCRWTNMPAVLVEAAFISSPRDAALLKKSWFRRRIAVGIATGVDQWMATQPYRQIYPRVSGSTAATLSAALSMTDFPIGAPIAVIARADRAVDMPGIPGLAVRLGGPLLWTGASEISSSTAAELARLAPQRIVLTGVDGSFDETAVAELAQSSGIATSAVEVISAPDPSSLSISIAESMGVSPTGEILVVDQNDSSAKLLAAPISAARGIPILLVSDGDVAPEPADRFNSSVPGVARLVMVGAAVTRPSSIATQAPSVRIGGSTVTQRAAVLNARYFTGRATGSLRPIVSSTGSPTGYLTAATRAGRVDQPLLPVTSRTLPVYTREWITNRRSAIGGFTLIDAGAMPYLMDAMLAKADRL
jgi:N-acetylmuramoyl-L-alanine amidase